MKIVARKKLLICSKLLYNSHFSFSFHDTNSCYIGLLWVFGPTYRIKSKHIFKFYNQIPYY